MPKNTITFSLINVTFCSQLSRKLRTEHLRGEVKRTSNLKTRSNQTLTHSVSLRKMNFTTFNHTIISCGLHYLPIYPENISLDLCVVFIIRIVVNALTCPFVIVLNILVMVAVKTKPQLRTKSNIALACLSTTDLVVGLLVQPLHIMHASFLLSGQGNIFYSLNKVLVTVTLTFKCLMVSFTHLILLSAERYIAVRHPFAYESKVTEARIIIASCLAWIIALLLPLEQPKAEPGFVKIFVVFILVPVLLYFPAMIYFNCAVYKEVSRSEKQIAANQVSLEANEKILKNKKAFYTTIVVLLASFLCHIPRNIFLAFFVSTRVTETKNTDGIETAIYLLPLIPVLNSLLNPLIYAVRIRYFRVAFIQLLSRKSTAEAEELERKIFGPRQIGETANDERGENIRASANQEEQQRNETLSDGRDTKLRIQSQEEFPPVEETVR